MTIYGQVGYARLGGGQTHAGLWNGTAASWVDLHAVLPSDFSSSVARSISNDATLIYIAGHGYNTVTERSEALLWTRPIPAPGAAAVLIAGLGAWGARRRGR